MTKTFHVNPNRDKDNSKAVHQASSLASDHASKISQISKNTNIVGSGNSF